MKVLQCESKLMEYMVCVCVCVCVCKNIEGQVDNHRNIALHLQHV